MKLAESKVVETLTPTTPKSKRLSVVAVTGAALAVVWSLLSWSGIAAPDVVVSSIGTLAALLAASFDR